MQPIALILNSSKTAIHALRAIVGALETDACTCDEVEGAGFHRWGNPKPSTIRLVTSFNTELEQVDTFIDAVTRCLRAAGV